MNNQPNSCFCYRGTEILQKNGIKTIRKVSIKNGKGYKSITQYRNGKRIGTIKKNLHGGHLSLIQERKFIPGLFKDCCVVKYKRKTRKKIMS